MSDELAGLFAPPGTRSNLDDAKRRLFLSPQEQALYERHLANLWGSGGVDNPDGSRSTLFVAGVAGPDGRQYNIPTVWSGAVLPVGEAAKNASRVGWDTFPSYPTAAAADARYIDQMHPFLDRDTRNYMNVRRDASLLPQLVDLYR